MWDIHDIYRLIHMWDIHNSFICAISMIKSCHTYEVIQSTRTNESYHTYEPHMDKSSRTYEWEPWKAREKRHKRSHVTRKSPVTRTHTWMSHVTRTHTWMSHVTRTHTWMSHVHTHAQVVQQVWTSHVTHMNESCHTYEWAMSHIWMSHVTYMNEPCHTYAWVMSHIWMSHVTHMHESCHTYEWAMPHIWMSHVTHMHE